MFIDRLEVHNNPIVKNTTYFSVGTHTHTHYYIMSCFCYACPTPTSPWLLLETLKAGSSFNLATKCN